MSKAAYARHRGCDEKAVRKAIAENRITATADGKIDPVAADAQWKANTRARVVATAPQSTRVDGDLLDGDEPVAPEAASVPAAPPPDDYSSWRGRREAADAEMAELRLEEERGKTIRVQAVREVLATTFAGTRDALLQIPARLSPVLAAEVDPLKVHELLQNEIYGALARLATVQERLTPSESRTS